MKIRQSQKEITESVRLGANETTRWGSLTPLCPPLCPKRNEKTLIQHHQVLHYARAFHKTSFAFAKTHSSYFHSHSLITLLLLHTFAFHRVLNSISWIFVGPKCAYCVFVLRTFCSAQNLMFT